MSDVWSNQEPNLNVLNQHLKHEAPRDSLTLRQSHPARNKRLILYVVALALDCASLLAGYLIAFLILPDAAWPEAAAQPIILIALPIFLMFELAREVQSVEALESRSVAIQRGFGALLATALIVALLSFLFKSDNFFRMAFVITFFFAAIAMVLGKILLHLVFNWWMGGIAVSTIVLQDGLVSELQPKCDFLDVEKSGLRPDLKDPTSIDALSRLIAPYDRVVVSCQYELRPLWATFLKSQGAKGEILIDRDLFLGAIDINTYGTADTLVVTRGPLSLSNRIQKRTFDIIVSIFALIAFAPIMLLSLIHI